MKRIYVSDSNIWFDFRNGGLLDELFGLSFEFCSTDFVIDELQDVDKEFLCQRGLIVETMEPDQISKLFDLMAEQNNSSLADVSCFLLSSMTGRPLLTGDGRLRSDARKAGLEVHGALWLLDQLIAEEVINAARGAEALVAMIEAGARLPRSECEMRLKRWRELT